MMTRKPLQIARTLLAVIAASCAGAAMASVDRQCQQQLEAPTFSVQVVRKSVPVAYVPSSSLQNLKSEHMAELRARGYREGKTHGLVRAQPTAGIQSSGGVLQFGSGQACAQPGFEVTLDMRQFEMQLARVLLEYPCEHDAVVDHETLHVHAHYRAMDEAAAALRNRWNQHWARRPMMKGTYPQVREQVEALQKEIVDFALAEVSARSDRYNKSIDTIEEYSRLGRMCEGGLTRIP
jgi:hypothetical protein